MANLMNIVTKKLFILKHCKIFKIRYFILFILFINKKIIFRYFILKIPFKLSYSLLQNVPEFPEEGEPLPDINDYPILDQEEAQRIFYARFVKECGRCSI